MSKKILIDSSKQTETRIALINDNRLEEYEIESDRKNRIKSNVYLAKISRVEASLQAAFVDFGGNKHGFLPFTEIHPDYFKIPISDQKILKDLISSNEETSKDSNDEIKVKENDDNYKNDEDQNNKSMEEKNKKNNKKRLFFNFFKKYKIQEVVKSKQVMLVQVSKEERGLKGAALTTFLSFAGRYCVLMPNSNNATGISRKISDPLERKKLKEIIVSIGVPDGMSLIIRTAGIGKTKKEIHKDLNYLVKQWEKIREKTLKSNAPSLINEEGDIVKRTIRDLYTKEISGIIVDGKDSYNNAKNYIKALIPNQLSKLKLYKEKKEKLFTKFNLEKEISHLYNTEIKLTSGGSIVINTTEALVAIDVNSGRATQQRNIENTALNTNIEAAKEIARQLKLRDLAGLVVIDFIDMEDYKNNFKVEKTLKNSTNSDRARIQIGRISSFGLLELSRQRLRTSIVEQSFKKCQICNGTGIVRNNDSIIEQLFKVIEESCSKNEGSSIIIDCHSDLASEILNKRKNFVIELENKYKTNLDFNFESSILLNDPKVKVDKNISKIKVIKKDIKKNISKKTVTKKNKITVNKKNLTKKTKQNIKNEVNENNAQESSPEITIKEDKNEGTKKGWWSESNN